MSSVKGDPSQERWLVFVITGGLIAFMQLDLLTIGEIIPDVARDLHVDSTGVGILVAAFALIFAASMGIVSHLGMLVLED